MNHVLQMKAGVARQSIFSAFLSRLRFLCDVVLSVAVGIDHVTMTYLKEGLMGRGRAFERRGEDVGGEVCALCLRRIPEGARSSLHHLTPKSKGGGFEETVRLHHVCHAAIHARYSEAEIARRLNTVEALRADPGLAAFVVWVRGKPEDFDAPTRRANTKRGPRRGKGA